MAFAADSELRIVKKQPHQIPNDSVIKMSNFSFWSQRA